ncbi:AzlD domain-containing protein [Deinococcus sp. HMF7604]|uniref:AzlD domain-containing protein n=1 Tax=Deinococcus betulae TaxID=2873312 RepID=UPI001CCFA392|nr:AzlD domain-containing protein [Deinococcus betulae]MBZ9752276.1 AzlD domain-containing protein [Deinococcus betulae]
MTPTQTALLIVAMGLVTFLPRYLPLVLWKDRALSAPVKAFLGYVPPAVLAAIVVPALLLPSGEWTGLRGAAPALAGGAATLLLMLRTKQLLLASGAGIAVFFGLTFLLQ